MKNQTRPKSSASVAPPRDDLIISSGGCPAGALVDGDDAKRNGVGVVAARVPGLGVRPPVVQCARKQRACTIASPRIYARRSFLRSCRGDRSRRIVPALRLSLRYRGGYGCAVCRRSALLRLRLVEHWPHQAQGRPSARDHHQSNFTASIEAVSKIRSRHSIIMDLTSLTSAAAGRRSSL